MGMTRIATTRRINMIMSTAPIAAMTMTTTMRTVTITITAMRIITMVTTITTMTMSKALCFVLNARLIRPNSKTFWV